MGRRSVTFEWLQAHVNYAGDECLVWPFCRCDQGYALAGFYGWRGKAYRKMCEMAHGPAPSPTHQAAHSCGNGHLGCINPKHLSWKTAKENAQDSVRHGTVRFGSGRPRRKLTVEQVAEIRTLQGVKSQRELGAMFGVTFKQIGKIQRGVSQGGQLTYVEFTDAEASFIRDRATAGEPFEKSAKDLGRTKGSVSSYAARNKIERAKKWARA